MITPKQAADAINYLFAAQALTAVDNMDAVWCDYINAEIPELNPTDMLPAARLCLKTWASEGRSWKVDLPRYVQALRRVRRDRWDTWRTLHGEPAPLGDLTGDEHVAWLKAARTQILAGAPDRAQVETIAWQAIGRTPPPVEPTRHHQINTNQIGKQP